MELRLCLHNVLRHEFCELAFFGAVEGMSLADCHVNWNGWGDWPRRRWNDDKKKFWRIPLPCGACCWINEKINAKKQNLEKSSFPNRNRILLGLPFATVTPFRMYRYSRFRKRFPVGGREEKKKNGQLIFNAFRIDRANLHPFN